MTIHYGILFRLSLLHDFYGGEQDNSAVFQPSSDTRTLMRNYRMLSKVNRGKLEIGAESSKMEKGSVLSDSLQEPMELWFTLHLQDTYWANYTEILPKAGHIYFFSNENGKDSEGSALLHATEKVSEEDQYEVLGNTELVFPIDAKVALVRKGIEDEDYSGNIRIVRDKQVLRTQALEEGKYEITSEDETRKFIYLKNRENVHGALQIMIDPENNNLIPIVDKEWNLQTPDLKIHFKNRKTNWRYLITKNQLTHLEGLEITNGSEKDLFTGPEDIKGPDGGERLLFTSNEPMAITAKPTQLLQLKKNMKIENRSEAVVIDRLPVPNKENLYRVGEDGSILTDLFINL